MLLSRLLLFASLNEGLLYCPCFIRRKWRNYPPSLFFQQILFPWCRSHL